jgi:hypothetical protein
VPDPQLDQPRFCSRCGQPIVVAGAKFCKDCGAPVAATQIFAREPGFNPIVAFVLSVIPGLGQVYKGRVTRGVIWFCAVILAYALGPLGPIARRPRNQTAHQATRTWPARNRSAVGHMALLK